MIFPQPFIFFGSIGLVLAISSVIFVWRFNSIKNKIKEIPRVLLLLSRVINKKRVKVLEESLKENSVLFETIQPYIDGINFNAPQIKNANKIILLFDISKNTIPIEEQLKEFENIKSFCDSREIKTIAIYSDEMDEGKVKKLKEIFGEVYIFSEKNLITKELSDIKRLINSLMPKPLLKTLS